MCKINKIAKKPLSKRKSETSFINQIPPLNLGKITLGTHFCHSKVVFRPFYLFCTFLSRFQSVKTPLTKSAILQSKESSNQKMQENKLALKFNFTQEFTRDELFLKVLVFHQQCHRALICSTANLDRQKGLDRSTSQPEYENHHLSNFV